jgi:hypothetical protein
MLSQKNINQINDEFGRLNRTYDSTFLRIAALSQHILVQPKAIEYMTQGVGRRLKLACRCISNIYRIFPPDRTELLKDDELSDICINLHAFYLNVFGLLDNLAWVLNHERQLSLNKMNVGLYDKRMRQHLSSGFDAHLQSLSKWYDELLKHYRDALAHRIPLYVPPFLIPTDDPELKSFDPSAEKRIAPFYLQSVDESPKQILMHAQLLADFKTVESIVRHFCMTEFPDAESIACYFLDPGVLAPPPGVRDRLQDFLDRTGIPMSI